MYSYEEIREQDIEELTEIMTRAFNDDTRMHTSLKEDGPVGYSDGSLIHKLMQNYISRKIIFENQMIGMYSVSKDEENASNLFILTEE